MIFNFGVLSWLLAVLETMIAAPMVALGLTHPEGHEIYGKAEPAVMLLTNVFLRPSLMIFGFIGGIIICFIGVNFINFSFQYFIGNVGTGGLQKGGLHVLFIAVIYIYLVIAIVNMAFSLIHIIPDKVLSWIQGGAQSQFGEYSKAGEQTVKGGFESSAGKVEKTAGEFGAEARKNQVKYEKEKTEGDAASVQLKKE
jgi:defect-in-organelle-trafficking protein DotA